MLLNCELLHNIFPDFIVEHCEEVPANTGVFEIRHPNFPGRFLKIYAACEKSLNITNRTTPYISDVTGVLCVDSDKLGSIQLCEGIVGLSYTKASEISENGYHYFKNNLMKAEDISAVWYSQLS